MSEEEEKTSVQDAITQARKEATNLQQQIKKKKQRSNKRCRAKII